MNNFVELLLSTFATEDHNMYELYTVNLNNINLIKDNSIYIVDDIIPTTEIRFNDGLLCYYLGNKSEFLKEINKQTSELYRTLNG